MFWPFCSELELLLMPKNKGGLPIVQWPLFLLASKVENQNHVFFLKVFPCIFPHDTSVLCLFGD
jgi:hypothetical protein